MNDNIAIKYIFIYPRNKLYVSYIINSNDEIHTMTYDSLYKFVCQYVKPPNTLIIKSLLYSFRIFLVDITKQFVQELFFDYENEIEKLKSKFRKIDFKKVEIEKVKMDNKKREGKKNLVDLDNKIKEIFKFNNVSLYNKNIY